MGLINHALPWSCMVWALQEINSSTAGIINGTVPLFVLLFAHFVTSDERLSWRRSAAVAIGIGGVCLMIGPEAVRRLNPTSVGQLVFLGTSVVLALAAIWGRRLKHLHPLVAATGTITCAAFFAVPAATLVDGLPSAMPSVEAGVAMLCLSVLSTVCAYTLFFSLLARVGASNLVLVNFLVPAVALSFGTFVLGETLAPSALVGIPSVAIALLLADGRLLTIAAPARCAGDAPDASRCSFDLSPSAIRDQEHVRR
jgi:drug/metabolite transporter (DMT)-like permease